MKIIEVKEHDPGAGNECIASRYPGPGAYYIARLNGLYFVSASTAWIVCVPPDMPNPVKEIAEPQELAQAEAVAVRPYSDTADVIRALNLPLIFAAALHKDAAVALADGEAMKGGA